MPTYDWPRLTERLKRALGLNHQPVAISFSQECPDGVQRFEGSMPPPADDGRTGKVPAGCVFWIKAETRAFTTQPEDHFNCSVGSVTHGLKTLDEVLHSEDVQKMVACEWVTPEEAKQLPAVGSSPRYITYGPLAETSIIPDVVLLRISAFQAMVIHDAFGEMSIVGRPQCHIIPIAKEHNQIAMSTGCMLSRVRTGMPPDQMTCTIPGHRLEEVVKRLESRRRADATLAAYANQDARRFAEP